jgi:hypothetical protein
VLATAAADLCLVRVHFPCVTIEYLADRREFKDEPAAPLLCGVSSIAADEPDAVA